ncbi:MAG: DUF4234 domain-containing protein [Chloroflexi bacterium]|nr:DUF4234 domain-containing protein [Chloroflexota bacterium]
MVVRATGKIRNPVIVVILSLITLGIYFVYWFYRINKEIARYDWRIETRPAISALAVTVGSLLIVPPYISAYTTASRARRMFKDFQAPVEISPGLAGALYALLAVGYPVLSLLYPAYLQAKLNRFWRHETALSQPHTGRRAA